MKNLNFVTVWLTGSKILFGLIAFTLNSFAATPVEIRGIIQNQIDQRHPTADNSFWDRLGPEAIPVIKQMYKESNDVRAKSWLIDGMGHFDDPEMTSILKNGITSTDDEITRKEMLAALLHSQGDQAYEFAEPYLKSNDGHVRMAVALGMRNYANSDRARKRLDEFSRQEKTPWVKDALKAEKSNDLLEVKKQGEDERVSTEAPKPVPAALPEKAWAGEWKGAYITPLKNTAAILNLTLVNEKPKKDEVKWKLNLKLPKQAKRDLNEKDIEIVYYQSNAAHWIEIRSKKDDSVFIGQRKAK